MSDALNSAFCDALIGLAEANKQIARATLNTMIDIAALRETVGGLDPTFHEVFPRKRDQAEKKKAQLVQTISELLQTSDELIHSLRDMRKELL